MHRRSGVLGVAAFACDDPGSAAHRFGLRRARETIKVSAMAKRYFVYILTNTPRGVLYVGVTNNLARRTSEHKQKAAPGFTTRYGVSRLVYFEECASILEARDRERAVKRWRRDWKIKLIEDLNPHWRDLYGELVLL
jgi:putative endonuclease